MVALKEKFEQFELLIDATGWLIAKLFLGKSQQWR